MCILSSGRPLAYLSLDFVSIFAGDDLLNSSWHKDVTRFEHQVLTFVGLSAGETDNGAVFVLVVFQFL